MISALGIDLGTTFCCVAYTDSQGKAHVIPNADDEYTTPSVIFFSQDEVFVGKRAIEAKMNAPSNTIELIKRSIGNKNAQLTYSIWNEEYSPEEMSALLLYKLVKDANTWLMSNNLTDREINNVVITIPANFNDDQRNATILAGKLAGLNVISMINEPTAAAIAHGISLQSGMNYLVFDLGGGTFDLTLMHVNNQRDMDVIASDGHMNLGGKNWDESLRDYLLLLMEDEFEIKKSSLKPNDHHRLLEFAKNAKIELTDKESYVLTFNIASKRISLPITRQVFENRSLTLMSNINIPFQHIDERIKDNEHITSINSVDKIILVGGSSRMPMIQNMAIEKFGADRVMMGEFDHAIAKGAAISANKSIKIRDVTPKCLGILINGENGKNKVHVMIEKDTKLPVTAEQEFIANPGSLISVKQGNIGKKGEDLSVMNFMPIGEFKLDVKARSTIKVAYTFDENGMLTVSYWGESIPRKDVRINSFSADAGDELIESGKAKLKQLIDALQF